MKVFVAGNCQATSLAELVTLATGISAKRKRNAQETEFSPTAPHVIFAQPQCKDWFTGNVVLFPRIVMPGFFPDVLSGEEAGKQATLRTVKSPLRSYHSSIVMKAWREGLSARGACALFNAATFDRLGFFDFYEMSKAQLLAEGVAAELELEGYFQRWSESGCFMHIVNHPKGQVMNDIAEAVLSKTDLPWKPIEEDVDRQARGCGWPLYPELAERIGLEGKYEFRMHSDDGGHILDLKEFIEKSFDLYATQYLDRKPLPSRLNGDRYRNLGEMVPVVGRGKHPYSGLPEYQFWRKLAHGDVDPVTSSFMIEKDQKIATAGSCFAQHIARALKARGFNYFVTETDPGSRGSNYGVYSARYGNIYTVRQLVQLFDRAYGQFEPNDVSWQRGDEIVDPFRPEIERDGFESEAAMLASREVHFEAVRNMFEQLDIFVFTLGLTEAWRAKSDGAVFPLAPGVSGGLYDTELYEFVNFSVTDVIQDLRDFFGRLSKTNRRARAILTVSPVPLAATYEPNHVLVSTAYSKSVLRVAADQIARNRPNVTYFPSYEIITGSFNRGAYFAENLRTVTPEGVDHVMRMFMRHFTPDPEMEANIRNALEVVCEEEQLRRLK